MFDTVAANKNSYLKQHSKDLKAVLLSYPQS